MVRTGVMDDASEVRWDIRPAPRWGTIEVRACDGMSTLPELAAVAALVQVLVEHFSRELDEGRELPTIQPWFVRENKWRAARYGLDARIIVDSDGTQRPGRRAPARDDGASWRRSPPSCTARASSRASNDPRRKARAMRGS